MGELPKVIKINGKNYICFDEVNSLCGDLARSILEGRIAGVHNVWKFIQEKLDEAEKENEGRNEQS